MNRKTHWERIYATKGDTDLSWFQVEPALSLEMIRSVAPGGGRILDVGGGDSVLVDRLLDVGFERIAALDISGEALGRAKTRLRDRASRVRWIEADVTSIQDVGRYDLWHDRAVFHFLTEPEDRRTYVALARRSIVPGGHLVLATFAPEGPAKCSGLEVRRYDAVTLAEELGEGFSLVRAIEETHLTPWGSPQAFTYALFRRSGV